MIEEWHARFTEGEHSWEQFRTLGGYFEKSSRETLCLDKNSRRFLQKIARRENDITFRCFHDPYERQLTLEKFYIDVNIESCFPSVPLKNINNCIEKWKPISCPATYHVKDVHFVKEVLTLPRDVKTFLCDKVFTRYVNVEFERNTGPAQKRLYINDLLISPAAKTEVCKEIPIMLTNFHLSEIEPSPDVSANLCISDLSCLSYEFKERSSRIPLERLTIDLLNFPKKKAFEAIPKSTSISQEWIPPESFPGIRSRIAKLFLNDEEFHPLDIYKFNEGMTVYGVKLHPKNCFRLLTKKWRIDRNILKNLVWEPFKKLVLPSNMELLEQMEYRSLDSKDYLLNFERKIYCGKDLIALSNISDNRENDQLNRGSSFLERSRHNDNDENMNSSSDELDSGELTNKRALSCNSSYIDKELVSIITSKRSKLDNSLYHSDNPQHENNNDNGDDDVNSNLIYHIHENKMRAIFSDLLIVVNAASIEKHHSIFSMLNKMDAKVLEVETYDACDIVVGPSSCMMIIGIDQIIQGDMKKTQHFENIEALKARYNDVIVILMYSEKTTYHDVNLAYKVQLLLMCCHVDCHLVEKSNVKIVIDWIRCYLQPMHFREESIYSWTIEKEVLLDLGIHPVAIHTIMHECSLKTFLTMSAGKRAQKYSRILTKQQLDYVDEFVSLAW